MDISDELKLSIGKALKARRLMKGLTIEGLSGLSGIGDKSIWKIENGKQIPSLMTILKLAKGLDLKNPLELLFDTAHDIYPKITKDSE